MGIQTAFVLEIGILISFDLASANATQFGMELEKYCGSMKQSDSAFESDSQSVME